jgi:hypothetical protein
MILGVHKDITELFKKISGLHKRSLASKYLHFHFPRLFFIYDTRAVNAVSKLSGVTKRPVGTIDKFDRDYQVFVGKCLDIRNYIHKGYNHLLTPRELDNLLLEIDRST